MRPLLTIASAAAFTCSAVTAPAKQFQLFQPMAGVKPMVRAANDFEVCFWRSQRVFGAEGDHELALRGASAPVIRPVLASSSSPAGSPVALKVIGRSPVAAMVNRNG